MLPSNGSLIRQGDGRGRCSLSLSLCVACSGASQATPGLSSGATSPPTVDHAKSAAPKENALKAAIDRHSARFLDVPGMHSVAIGVHGAGEVRIGSTYGQAEFLADLRDVVLKGRPEPCHSNPGPSSSGRSSKTPTKSGCSRCWRSFSSPRRACPTPCCRCPSRKRRGLRSVMTTAIGQHPSG